MPSLLESILKNIHFYIIPRTRERKFSGAQFPQHRCGKWACSIKRDPPPPCKEDDKSGVKFYWGLPPRVYLKYNTFRIRTIYHCSMFFLAKGFSVWFSIVFMWREWIHLISGIYIFHFITFFRKGGGERIWFFGKIYIPA